MRLPTVTPDTAYRLLRKMSRASSLGSEVSTVKSTDIAGVIEFFEKSAVDEIVESVIFAAGFANGCCLGPRATICLPSPNSAVD